MRRVIVRNVLGQKRLEAVTLTELPRTDWRGGAQWMAQDGALDLVGLGDTIEEACDALATNPVRLETEEDESDESWRRYPAAA